MDTRLIQVNLSKANIPFRSLVTTSGASLTTLSRNYSSFTCSSSDIEQRLSEMQRSLLETRNAVLSQNYLSQQLVQPALSHSQNQLGFRESEKQFSWLPARALQVSNSHDASLPYTFYGGRLEESRLVNMERSSPNKRLSRIQNDSIDTSFEAGVLGRQPSPYENPPSYFPEAYSIDQRVPACLLTILNSCEASSSLESRTNSYEVFYLASPRRWCRLNISITIHRGSIYWLAARLSPQRDSARIIGSLDSATILPPSMFMQMKRLFSKVSKSLEDLPLQ